MQPSEKYHVDQLLRKLESQPDSIRWKDLVSDPREHHSASEREMVLQVGTGANRVMEGSFHGWQRPWFFWNVLKAGLLLIAACFALVYGCELLLGLNLVTSIQLQLLIPPMVIPVVLMIFFWELNVPRNLTIWELLGCFLVGTLLSMGGTALMFVLVGSGSGPMAAFREEPSKLLAGIAIMLYYSKVKHKRIWGLTGLVIGAAVGSGFSAFETITYGLDGGVRTVIMRVCFAVVGHTLYSCSYVAALALHSPNGQITTGSFSNPDFLLTFGCSVLCHALWNTAQIPIILRLMVTLLLLWYSALYIIRKCLREVWETGHGHRTVGAATQRKGKEPCAYIELRCLRGEVAGKKWSYPCGQVVSIGRGPANTVCLPGDIDGISRNHCYLEARSGSWMVTDVHSTYGTYLQLPGERICKLIPGKAYPVPGGSLLYLGSRNFCLGVSVF